MVNLIRPDMVKATGFSTLLAIFLAREFLTKEEYLKEEEDSLGYLTFEKDDITDIIGPSNEIEALRDEISKIEKLKDIDLKIIDTIDNKCIKYLNVKQKIQKKIRRMFN